LGTRDAVRKRTREEVVNLAKTGQIWAKTPVFGAVFEKLSCCKSFVFEGCLCKSFVFCAAELRICFSDYWAKWMETGELDGDFGVFLSF
jgi:hypothetical protein